MISKILQIIDSEGKIDISELSSLLNYDTDKIVSLIRYLLKIDGLIAIKDISGDLCKLTERNELMLYKNRMSFQCVPSNDSEINGDSLNNDTSDNSRDKGVEEELNRIQHKNVDCTSKITLEDLQKLCQLQTTTQPILQISKGENFRTDLLESEISCDILSKGLWKEIQLIPYNFSSLASPLKCGYLLPLTRTKQEVRCILFAMGFIEGSTNSVLDTTSENFDTLLPPESLQENKIYLTTHIKNHKVSETQNVHPLRTDMLSASIRMLQNVTYKPFKPQKWYSIDRVFNSKTCNIFDSTEGFQIEGVIMDYELNISDLIGVIDVILQHIDIQIFEMKPGFNTYTEPTLDIYCYHEDLFEWIKIGSSGMVRPEILKSCGANLEITAMRWGLSLDRLTMIKYNIDDIKQLNGPQITF